MTRTEQITKLEKLVKMRKNVNEQYEASIVMADGHWVSYAASVDHENSRTTKARAKTALVDKIINESKDVNGIRCFISASGHAHPWPFNK